MKIANIHCVWTLLAVSSLSIVALSGTAFAGSVVPEIDPGMLTGGL